jgi:hypothetical protein
MTKIPWRVKGSVHSTPKVVTSPGECIAVDQLESTTPGFIGQLKGNILTKVRYRYATVFVDQYSDYTYVHFHIRLTSEETVKAKHAFEAHLLTHGVKVQHYHADNGRFQDNLFKDDCKKKNQQLTFCGVNAHFQNGRAEKKIRDLQDATRTSLLHAMRKWPDAININLWPYAMRYAMDVHNALPSKGKEDSPLELLTGVKRKIPMHQFHHFGCPTYVLDSNLQGGKRGNMKWKERARVGINLGFSPQHARSVHLILSMTTGCASPQFHCIFEDHFQTLSEKTIPPSRWQEKAYFKEPIMREENQGMIEERIRLHEGESLPEHHADIPGDIHIDRQRDQEPATDQRQVQTQRPPPRQEERPQVNPQEHQEREPPQNQPERRTRSQRVICPPTRFTDYVSHEHIVFEALHVEHEENVANDDPIVVMKATSDLDTLYLLEAMKKPDFDKFQEAMQKEIDEHNERGNWKLRLRSSLPKNATVLPAVWAMKRKRRISTREIYKWKVEGQIECGR